MVAATTNKTKRRRWQLGGGRAGGRPGMGQCSMKENTIDYEAALDVLAASGYRGYLAVEYVWIEWENMNRCDNVSETLLMRDRLLAHLNGNT